MVVSFRQIDDDTRLPGRPPIERTAELKEALIAMAQEAEKTNKYAFAIDLAKDEREEKHFSRFMQRCRSAANIAGLKISVTNPHDGKTAKVRICLQEDEDR